MATNRTLRQRMTCDKCGEAHTNDNLQIFITPAQRGSAIRGPVILGDPEQECSFCVYGADVSTANGAPTRFDRKKNSTREEDRLEAEEQIEQAKDGGKP